MKKDVKKFEKLFKALANKKRLEIILFLFKYKKASVGEIAEKIKTSTKSTSKHLLLLYHTDLLDKEQRGGLIFYFINDKLGNIERIIVRLLRNYL